MHHFFDDATLSAFLTECTRVWGQNIDAWTSDEPEPLVDTGNGQIFMNKFPDGPKAVYTLWNASGADAANTSIALTPRDGYHYVDLFNHRELTQEANAVRMDVPVKTVSTFGELPKRLSIHSRADGTLVASWPDLSQPSLLVWGRPRVAASTATLVFEDNFDGAQGSLDTSKWLTNAYAWLEGAGTALFIKGVSNWANFNNGYVWDYSKTHTFEVKYCFPFYAGKVWTQNFIMASNTDGGGPKYPRFELYPQSGFFRMLCSGEFSDEHVTGTNMLPWLNPSLVDDYNILQLVVNKDFRRAYVNGQLYCNFEDLPISNTSTRLAFGLQGNDNLYMRVDYARVYEGDASVAEGYSENWVSKAVTDVSSSGAAFDPYKLFDTTGFAEMSIQLLDGGQLVDEWVGLPPDYERSAAAPGWELLQ